MSNYEIRKQYRIELHAARCADHDQSAERYMRDAKTLNEWLARDYRALGYHVVRVPVMPPDERLAFLVNHMLLGI